VIIQQRKKRRGRATHGHENERTFGNSEIVIFESHSVVELSVERERVMREKERKRRERTVERGESLLKVPTYSSTSPPPRIAHVFER